MRTLGKSRRIKTKRLAEEILEQYSEGFSTDFDKNKRILEDILMISSKTIRNTIAGYITRVMNNQLPE